MRQASDSSAAQKVCRILKTLSTPGDLRLTDIAQASGVNKATALRLLEEMEVEGFIKRNPESKLYSLGEECVVLGLALQGSQHVRERARPALIRMAGLSGDTVLLSIRSGCESICIDREFGGYPVRATHQDLGIRRPLGAGSMALLAWLSDDEIDAALEVNQTRIARDYPRFPREMLKDQLALTRERGYAILLDVVVEHMGGIGVPIFGKDGRPCAAVSIAALTERISGRLDILLPAFKKMSDELSEW